MKQSEALLTLPKPATQPATMKALVYHGPGRRSWEDKPRPAIREATNALVRITTTTIHTDLPSDLPFDVAAPVREGLPAATAAAAHLPAQVADAILTTARDAFTHSMNVVSLVGCLLLLTTALAATLTLRRTTPQHPTTDPSETPELQRTA